MKTLGMFVIIAGLLYCSTAVSSELGVTDLDKITDIVDKAAARLEKRFSAEIQAQKEFLSAKIEAQGELFSAKIEAQGKRMDDLVKRVEFQGYLIISLIVSIIAFVSVPMGILIYQYNKHRDRQDREIKTLRQKTDALEEKQVSQA